MTLSMGNTKVSRSEPLAHAGTFQVIQCQLGNYAVLTSRKVRREMLTLLDLPIGIDILMNLQTHQQASARARAYANSNHTNHPPIQEVRDTAY